MKTALSPRLAWDGLRKYKRLFTPYLLTCICMVMMFYILSFLGSPETCALLPRGSNTTGKILNLGSFVIFVFSAIFLYYTNSFLVRRREREFGLYNVLGMNKRNLARIVTWESLITAVLSLVLTDEGDIGKLSAHLINAGFSVSFSPLAPKEHTHVG